MVAHIHLRLLYMEQIQNCWITYSDVFMTAPTINSFMQFLSETCHISVHVQMHAVLLTHLCCISELSSILPDFCGSELLVQFSFNK